MARCLAVVFGFALTFAELVGASRESSAQDADVIAALSAGRTAEVQPYPLRQSADGRSTVGAVYTQFIRVARYVWQERQKGFDVQVDALPASIKQPFIHVAMQAPTRGESGSLPVMVAIDRPPSALPAGVSVYFVPNGRRLVPSTSMVTADALEHMVGRIPVDGTVLVGVFPATWAGRPVPEFCVYIGDQSGRYDVVSGFTPGPLR